MRSLLIGAGVFFGIASLIAVLFVVPFPTLAQRVTILGFVLSASLLFVAIPKSVGLPRLTFPPSDRLFTVLGTGKYLDKRGDERVLVILSAREGEIVLYNLPEERVCPDHLEKGDLVALRGGVLRKYREERKPIET